MIEYLRDLISKSKEGDAYGKFRSLFLKLNKELFLMLNEVIFVGSYTLQFADDFTYTDPVS